MKENKRGLKPLISLILVVAILFNVLNIPLLVNEVVAYGTNNDTLDPTSWIGSGEGDTPIKMLSGNVDVPSGVNISVDLLNDGKFRVNAPNLQGNFAYYYNPDDEEYAEPLSAVYHIFSSKEAKKKQAIAGKTAGCDNVGESDGWKKLTGEAISTTGKKYYNINIIETIDYNEPDMKFNGKDGKSYNLRQYSGMTYGWGDFEIPYGVLFNVGTGHGKTPNAISYDTNGNVTLPNVDSAYSNLFDGWYTSATGGTKIGNAGQTVNWSNDNLTGYKNTTLYAHFKTHTHNWKYVEGTGNDTNKIYALCDKDGEGCSYYGTEKNDNSPVITIDTNASKTYDGAKASDGTLTKSTNWSLTNAGTPTVSYIGIDGTTYNSTTAPTNAGKYKATIKVGTANAYKEFEITQRVAELEWTTPSEFTYDNKEHKIEASVKNKVGTDTFNITYENKSDENKINKATEVGDYTAIVTGIGNNNYKLDNTSKNWKINYLTTGSATLEGTKKIPTSDWYTSVVSIKPDQADYKISEDKTDWKNELATSTDGTHKVEFYLKDKNGYITDKMNKEFKIDSTAPNGEIKIKNNGFKAFLNGITFGNFYKDIVDVEITGTDNGSGIDKICYQKVEKESDYNENETWTEGNKFSVNANEKFIVYAKITDKAGNETIINSEGHIIYKDSVDKDVVNYNKTTKEDKTTKIDIAENTIKSITIKDLKNSSEKELTQNDYEIKNNVIVLKGEYLDTLDANDYEIVVKYNPMGEQFVKGEDANESKIQLHILKKAGNVKITNDISKVYDNKSVEETAYTKNSSKDVVVEYKEANEDDTKYTKKAPTKAGKYIVRVTAPEDENYTESIDTKEFTISKADAKIETKETTYEKVETDKDFKIEGVTTEGESKVIFMSEDEKVATVDENGNVKVVGVGETKITLTMPESDNYEKTTKTILVKVNAKKEEPKQDDKKQDDTKQDEQKKEDTENKADNVTKEENNTQNINKENAKNNSNAPKTSDNFNITLWSSLLVVSVLGMFGISKSSKGKRHKSKH